MSSTTLKAVRHRNGGYGCVDELFIRASAERVFETLVDFNGREKWGPGRARIISGEEKVRGGSKVQIWTAGHSIKMEVLSLEAPGLITLRATDGPILGDCEWQVIAEGAGARVRLVWKVLYPRTFMLGLLFLLSGTFFHSRAAARLLYALKKYLE